MQNYHENSIRLEHAFKDTILRYIKNDQVKNEAVKLAKADYFDVNSIIQIIHIFEIINSSNNYSMNPRLINQFNSFRNYLHEIQISIDLEYSKPLNYSVRLIGERKYQEITDECVIILSSLI